MNAQLRTLLVSIVALSACQGGNPLATVDAGPVGGAGGGSGSGASGGDGQGGDGQGGTGGQGSGGGGSPGGGDGGGGGSDGGSGGSTDAATPTPDGSVGPVGDRDDDGVSDADDNCPGVANHNQEDPDADGHGSVCDLCPAASDPEQVDTDADGLGDACDPDTPMGPMEDRDDDGVVNDADNCPNFANHGQENADADAAGDACDACPTDPDGVEAPCAPLVTVDPLTVEFGSVPVNCGRAEQVVRLEGPANACLLAVDLAGPCGGVTVQRPGPDDACTPLGTGVDLTVQFAPANMGNLNCTLQIRVTNGREVQVEVPVTGSGGGRRVTERFVAAPPDAVDLLVVMDDSASMQVVQFAFASLYDQLFSAPDADGIAWRLGVVTTDMDDANRRGRFNAPGAVNAGAGAEDAWERAIAPGTNGSGIEQGLAATQAALTNNRNPGFRRVEADLAVVIISDEDDQSPNGVATYVNTWLSVTDGHPERVTAYGYVGVNAGGAAEICDVDGRHGDAAARYVQAFSSVGGRGYRICDDPAQALRNLSNRIFGPRRAFLLSHGVDGPVSVQVNGNADARWVFDPATQVIRLPPSADSVPDGAAVTAEYDAHCP